MEEIPSDYDVIIVGTGLVESIYAAAAARVGKTVLHLDGNDYYSGEWAVLNLNGLREWVERHRADPVSPPLPPPTAEPGTLPLQARTLVHSVVERWYVEEDDVADEVAPPDRPSEAAPESTAGPETSRRSAEQAPSQAASGVAATPAERRPEQLLPSAAALSASTQSADAAQSIPAFHQSTSAPESTLAPGGTEESACSPESGPPAGESASVPETGPPAGESASVPETGPPAGESSDSEVPTSRKNATWTINRMRKLSRRFNIDLAPKVLYSRGALVELLISSNIARYAEFRSVGQLLTPLEDQLQPVPSSRADVFTTRHVSVVEKRLLMKLLTFCLDFDKYPDQYRGFEQKPFGEFLRSRRLTDNLTHHVIHAIAMVTPETPTLEALLSTQKFLRSLGRYGNTPFLWPMYGSGELPQCFCRMCAVFGGVYHLSRGVEALTLDESGACTGVLSRGQRLACRRLLLEEAYRPAADAEPGLSRAIVICDRPLYEPAGDQVVLIRLPAQEDQPGPVTVLQLGAAASAAPDGLYLVHLTCEQRRSAEHDLSPAVERLRRLAGADGVPPRVLGAVFFSRRRPGAGPECPQLPPAVSFCGGPDAALGFDGAVQEARDLFSAHFPDEEFLPRAPDPEEIIFFDDGAPSVVTGGARPAASTDALEPGRDASAGGAVAEQGAPADRADPDADEGGPAPDRGRADPDSDERGPVSDRGRSPAGEAGTAASTEAARPAVL